MFESTLLIDPAEVYPDLVAAIDAVPARAARGGTAVECDLRVRSLLLLSRRVEALLLSEVAAFDDQGFASALGAASTGNYLAAHGHLDPAAARRLVIAARTADRLPQLGSMLTAGDISVDHVAAVGYATRRLPADVVACEDHTFATLAASGRPGDLRAAGKHLQAIYDTDAVSRDANHVRDSRYLTLAQTFGDAWHLDGQLTPEDGVALTLVLDSLSHKNGPEDTRTPTQRRADALVEMTTLTLRAGELPDTGGDQPRVTLLLQATTNPFAHHRDNLVDGLHDIAGAVTGAGAGSQFSLTAFDLTDAQLLGTTAMISPETLQRICCDAQFNITTADATGNILNQGRSCRDPNLPQRRAVKIRDKHCVFPGCDIPPQRCIIHHLHFWAEGGRTDLCNLALVCLFHHHLIHEDHWTLTATPATPAQPAGGWTATAPDEHQLRQTRQRAA